SKTSSESIPSSKPDQQVQSSTKAREKQARSLDNVNSRLTPAWSIKVENEEPSHRSSLHVSADAQVEQEEASESTHRLSKKTNHNVAGYVEEEFVHHVQKQKHPKPPISEKLRTVDGKIIVAVDFGQMPYLGALRAIVVIKSPRNRPSTPYYRLRTDRLLAIRELQYTEGGYKWGFQIASDAKRFQWFKLGLDPDQASAQSSLAQEFPDEKAAVPGDDQTPERLVKDYLSAIRQHAEAVLKKNLHSSIVSIMPVEYVITVPAVWSDAAKAKTRLCAEQAGMGEGEKLQLVAEPEAAAVYALSKMRPFGLRIGDTFILCDAGGGTVDLIAYKITAITPTLRVVEVTKGSGDQCGSIFLNRRFASFLRRKLGSHPAWREDMLEDALRRFETDVKRCFDGCMTTPFDIPVPGFPDDETYDVRRTKFRLQGADLYEIFEPVIKKITNLVNQQIEATEATNVTVRAIVMVGGFSENEYLHKRICQAVEHQGIEVQRSPQSWTAVVRGALMKGLAEVSSKSAVVSITGRVARNSFATESAKPYDKVKHPVTQRFWSAANDRFEVNTYDWFVKKVPKLTILDDYGDSPIHFQGEKVTERRPTRLPYHSEHPVSDPGSRTVTITIVKGVHHNTGELPCFVDNREVETVGTIEVPLHRILEKDLKKRQGKDGEEWHIIDFALRVKFGSGETVYELVQGNKNYGRVTAEYV
ncbi:MAG: hypothetical protein Q9188_007572, partial [Gyalolechia gomerana]